MVAIFGMARNPLLPNGWFPTPPAARIEVVARPSASPSQAVPPEGLRECGADFGAFIRYHQYGRAIRAASRRIEAPRLLRVPPIATELVCCANAHRLRLAHLIADWPSDAGRRVAVFADRAPFVWTVR
jgi:hypothetical protein